MQQKKCNELFTRTQFVDDEQFGCSNIGHQLDSVRMLNKCAINAAWNDMKLNLLSLKIGFIVL